MDMGVRRDGNRAKRQDDVRWHFVEAGVVAKVEGSKVTGLLIYGDIDSERLRSIQLRRLDLIAESGSSQQWIGPVPPSPEQVEAAGVPVVNYVRETDPANVVITTYAADDIDDLIRSEASTRDTDTVDDYYRRLAAVVVAIAPHVARPNQRIAEVLDIDPNTVKQYIHRCRARGYLPPVRRKGE